jgi:hypothetical protein
LNCRDEGTESLVYAFAELEVGMGIFPDRSLCRWLKKGRRRYGLDWIA